MRIVPCEQGTIEWHAARTGRITGSRISSVLDVTKKGEEGAKRRTYRIELVAERLTGFAAEHYVSPEMAWGSEYEQAAREAYEEYACVKVGSVGFVLHPTLDFFGVSPDGLVGGQGCFEAKCPKTSTHLRWMMDGVIPEEHRDQCLGHMICTERPWCDFVSYDPRLPAYLRLFVVRMQRDEKRIKEIEQEVVKFNDEVEFAIAHLRTRMTPEKALDSPQEGSEYKQLMSVMDRVEMGI
jgi:hypothetical protein